MLLEFTAAVHSNSSDASLRLFVNGVYVAGFTGFPANGNAFGQFVVNRKYLQFGDNQFEIRPYNAGDDWGVRDIQASYLPILPLQLGVTHPAEYGHSSNPRYLSGLRATFNLSSISSGGIEVSMRGWDIDVSNEISILVNGRYVGRLMTTANSSYGPTNSFVVSPAKLRRGTNYIELIQRQTDSQWSGTENEKWAVRDLSVVRLAPQMDSENQSALPAIISLLLND